MNTTYMKTTEDAPYKPCDKCGAEINANWTIRSLQARVSGLESIVAEIEKDNLLSECESEWCGKTVVLGVQQKCHFCNVRAILNRETE